MKQTKYTLSEMSSERAVNLMNTENQHILKGGDWGGCCQYPPSGQSSSSGSSWWDWVWSWFQNNWND